jgi:hypothetical protein
MTRKALPIPGLKLSNLAKPPVVDITASAGQTPVVERVTCRPRHVPLGLKRIASALYEENKGAYVSESPAAVGLLR